MKITGLRTFVVQAAPGGGRRAARAQLGALERDARGARRGLRPADLRGESGRGRRGTRRHAVRAKRLTEEDLVRHLCAVNGCSEAVFRCHDAQARWQRLGRGDRRWTQDFSRFLDEDSALVGDWTPEAVDLDAIVSGATTIEAEVERVRQAHASARESAALVREEFARAEALRALAAGFRA